MQVHTDLAIGTHAAVLAQLGGAPGGTTGDTVALLINIGAAVAITGGAIVVILLVRRKLLRSGPGDASASASGLLDSLRKLHAEGKMTTEEFNRARAKIGASVRRSVPVRTKR